MKMWIRSLDFIMVKVVAGFLCRIGRFSNSRSLTSIITTVCLGDILVRLSQLLVTLLNGWIFLVILRQNQHLNPRLAEHLNDEVVFGQNRPTIVRWWSSSVRALGQFSMCSALWSVRYRFYQKSLIFKHHKSFS